MMKSSDFIEGNWYKTNNDKIIRFLGFAISGAVTFKDVIYTNEYRSSNILQHGYEPLTSYKYVKVSTVATILKESGLCSESISIILDFPFRAESSENAIVPKPTRMGQTCITGTSSNEDAKDFADFWKNNTVERDMKMDRLKALALAYQHRPDYSNIPIDPKALQTTINNLKEINSKSLEFKELDEFPETGCCSDITSGLISYLKTTVGISNPVYDKSRHNKICWNSKSYWYVTTQSNRTEYSIEQLNKFINPLKQKQNGSNKETNLQGIKTTDSRTTERGTVVMGCRRQQIAIGSRFEGNSTSIIKCRKRINSIKISKSVISKSDTR